MQTETDRIVVRICGQMQIGIAAYRMQTETDRIFVCICGQMQVKYDYRMQTKADTIYCCKCRFSIRMLYLQIKQTAYS